MYTKTPGGAKRKKMYCNTRCCCLPKTKNNTVSDNRKRLDTNTHEIHTHKYTHVRHLRTRETLHPVV